MVEDIDYDVVYQTLQAIKLVTEAPTTARGKTGTLVCPKCGGELVYTRFFYPDRSRGNREKQSFAFQCRTTNCLSASGH